MPTFIGPKEVEIDEKAYQQAFEQNAGNTITTDDILKGWNSIKDEILSDEFVRSVKDSPMYFYNEKS